MTDYTSSLRSPWYSYLSQIKTIFISGITRIGNWSFASCSNARSVTIPNSVTTIGERCFNECTALTSITIPSSVTAISDSCFNNCTAVTLITILGRVTTFGLSCFAGCTAVTSVTFKGAQPTTLASSSFSLGTAAVPVTATVYSSGWANATVFTSTVIGVIQH